LDRSLDVLLVGLHRVPAGAPQQSRFVSAISRWLFIVMAIAKYRGLA
jgi:hypothetical protein